MLPTIYLFSGQLRQLQSCYLVMRSPCSFSHKFLDLLASSSKSDRSLRNNMLFYIPWKLVRTESVLMPSPKDFPALFLEVTANLSVKEMELSQSSPSLCCLLPQQTEITKTGSWRDYLKYICRKPGSLMPWLVEELIDCLLFLTVLTEKEEFLNLF